MAKLEVDFSNRAIYSFLFVVCIILLSAAAYAYNSGGPPSTVGHSAEELQGVVYSDCRVVTQLFPSSTDGITMCCGANEIAVGGGIQLASGMALSESRIVGDQGTDTCTTGSTGRPIGWRCVKSGGSLNWNCFVACCTFS